MMFSQHCRRLASQYPVSTSISCTPVSAEPRHRLRIDHRELLRPRHCPPPKSLLTLPLLYSISRKITTKSIWAHPHFSGATIAQFLYVAAQAGIFSFFINSMTVDKNNGVINVSMVPAPSAVVAGRFRHLPHQVGSGSKRADHLRPPPKSGISGPRDMAEGPALLRPPPSSKRSWALVQYQIPPSISDNYGSPELDRCDCSERSRRGPQWNHSPGDQ